MRIKLKLKKDGTILKSEILDHERMNRPGQKFYKILAESALRAVRLCQPLRVPPTGYEKWKDLQLNFNPSEMSELKKYEKNFNNTCNFFSLTNHGKSLIQVDITRKFRSTSYSCFTFTCRY